ncbi:MAG TPA: hypothetical protein VH877_00485 [Polyangia bacterium]|jgi:hypothetical protein|nr:hypothetical protein [Polyangia bacterium]
MKKKHIVQIVAVAVMGGLALSTTPVEAATVASTQALAVTALPREGSWTWNDFGANAAGWAAGGAAGGAVECALVGTPVGALCGAGVGAVAGGIAGAASYAAGQAWHAVFGVRAMDLAAAPATALN